MDFFEAQARAKKSTSRLVVLFVIAVVGTVIANYAAAALALRVTHDYRAPRSGRYAMRTSVEVTPPSSWWQPQLFVGVSLATLAVVGLASLYKWSEFSAGGSAVAESVNGRRVDPHTTDTLERRLLNVVEEMAIASGVPVPAVYILDEEPGINAFAAGLTTSDAVVAVTRGTLEKLSRDELQGVIGHEFSHILNGDMRLNMRLTALVFGILVLGIAGRGLLWSLQFQSFGGSRDREGRNNGGIVIALAVIGLALLITGYVGYFFGRLIQAAVSRQREYLADASSVQFTRNPSGLAGALKKIGGGALGSTLGSPRGQAIGHFFFAQGFRSNFGGLWATHPPLEDRIRAIDPLFDGQMVVASEGVAGAREYSAAVSTPPPLTPSGIRPAPVDTGRSAAANAAVASVGTLTAEQIAKAQLLLDSAPTRLREASRSATEAPVLLFALLLDPDPGTRAYQRQRVASRAGADALRILDELTPAALSLRPELRLPLLQLALPALRQLPPTTLNPFFQTLDELIQADGRVTAFEFALQKLLIRTLAIGHAPSSAIDQIFSFDGVVDEISIVLSAMAHTSANDAVIAAQAFALGAAQIKPIEDELVFLDPVDCDVGPLDPALDTLATASLPIRQRVVTACAHIAGADGQILVAEAELLRAIAATLDVPMPPLLA